MEAQREEFVFQFRSLRCKAPRGWIGLRLRKTDSNRIRVASYSLASVWQTVKKGRAAAGKRAEDHHRALTKRAHSSAQQFLGTSPNRSKSSESDDARSCGAQPFGIFINPLNHPGDFTMALDVGFSGCNTPKSLCKVSCNPVSIKRRAEPITFTHHVIFQHFFVRRAVVWIFRLSSRA